MKLSILMALFLCFSCIKKTEETTPSTEHKRFDPLSVTPEDLTRLKAICNALEIKEERLPALISSSYNFDYAQKGCEESELGAVVDIPVTIQRPNLNYIFRKADGDSFVFPVETYSSGSMSVICANLNDLRSPIQTSNKGAVWFSTFTSSAHCASGFDSICIQIQKGEHVDDLTYKIHTNEWIKFKVGEDKKGFFVERKLLSTADCGTGKNIEKRAILK